MGGLSMGTAYNIFNGQRFLDFIEVEKFKTDISTLLGTELENFEGFDLLYQHLVENFPSEIINIQKTMFDNIFYSHMKNVFIDNIQHLPNLEIVNFKETLQELISNINFKETIPEALQSYMNEEGFYLIDKLNVSSKDTSFIAGMDYTVENNNITSLRVLYGEVCYKLIDNTTKSVYFLSGIEIDFESGILITSMKNVTDVSSEEERKSSVTINKMYNKVKSKVIEKLGIEITPIDIQSDRKAIYTFSKELDDKLLIDIRRDVQSRLAPDIKASIREYNKNLFTSEKQLSVTDKSNLEKKICSLLLSYYLDYEVKPKDLVKKAKDKKLLGYSTKLDFRGHNRGNSSTQSKNSKYPVAASDMFHSLYFNFENAEGLNKWSIAWFTDFNFLNPNDDDVIQTSIYITKENFKIVFRPTRALNREVIHHVISSINSFR